MLSTNDLITNKFVFANQDFLNLSEEDLDIEAMRIEKDYCFTLIKAYFPDIIEVFKGQNNRKITVPEKYYKNLSFLVWRFYRRINY